MENNIKTREGMLAGVSQDLKEKKRTSKSPKEMQLNNLYFNQSLLKTVEPNLIPPVPDLRRSIIAYAVKAEKELLRNMRNTSPILITFHLKS